MSEWRSYIRPTDLGWVILFSTLALFGPSRSVPMETTLIAMAAFQLIEPRTAAFASSHGRIAAILIKLALCYILIGYTGLDVPGDWSEAFNSPYHFIMLLPVISAATTMGALGTAVFTVLACLVYFSFYFLIDPDRRPRDDQWPHVFLRIVTFPLLGFLTYYLAEENRRKASDAQAAAAQLAEANASLRAAEDAVRRADRLAALGQLTAGLAHELRNPLSTIKSSSELLLRNLPAGNEVALELAGFVSSEVDRTNSLITRFLEFARPLKLKLEPSVDVTQILDKAVEQVLRHSTPFDVTIHRNYSPDVPMLALDPELMGLVFYNLLLNAAQASPKGAPITIKTRLADSMVEVAVIDRGSGIGADNLKNVFNPFFTTKSDGVGLGLAIVSKIVDEHRGKITVDSTPNEGSVFHVFLPVSKEAA